MTAQEILFYLAIAFFVLAVVFIAIAVAVFFLRNIPDVRADLSGKKRAEAVARIAGQRPGRDRRKGVARVEPTSGDLTKSERIAQQVPAVTGAPAPVQSGRLADDAVLKESRPKASFGVSSATSKRGSGDERSSSRETEERETTILPADNQSTTILENGGQVVQESMREADDQLAPVDGRTAAELQQRAESVEQVRDASFKVVRKIVLQEATDLVVAKEQTF